MSFSFRRFFCVVAIAVLTVMTAGCSTSEKPKTEDKPVEAMYNQAAAAMDSKDYENATKLFEEVERQHPYSPWASKAELMAAYASYSDERYDDAVMALDRFIEIHPGNPDTEYALYLKAMCYYEQITDVARDQEITREALDAFDALIRRYPDSRYARDAKFKYDLTRDHLAGKEMEIGRYYLHTGEINAAINRFLKVVKDYQTTTHVPEALHRLVECYLTLGINDQALKIAAVLGYNYPGSKWYEDTYNLMDPELRRQLDANRGFWDRTVDSIFKPN